MHYQFKLMMEGPLDQWIHLHAMEALRRASVYFLQFECMITIGVLNLNCTIRINHVNNG